MSLLLLALLIIASSILIQQTVRYTPAVVETIAETLFIAGFFIRMFLLVAVVLLAAIALSIAGSAFMPA